MSRSIGCRRSVVTGVQLAPGGDNDRSPTPRQARNRRGPALAVTGLALLLAAAGARAEPAEDPTANSSLEIQRQQIDGRLGAIERKEEELGRPPPAGSRLDPYEPALPPAETSGQRFRLELERRTLEGRRDAIDRDLGRPERGDNPSSRGLLDRVRGN